MAIEFDSSLSREKEKKGKNVRRHVTVSSCLFHATLLPHGFAARRIRPITTLSSCAGWKKKKKRKKEKRGKEERDAD